MSNTDLLKWFSEEEREECSYCRARASVVVSEESASFCLACGAITRDGVRLDVGGRVPAG